MLAASVALLGSVLGLLNVQGIYGTETPAMLNQVLAQDAVNLAVASPLLLMLAVLALRGSIAAHLLWLGAVAFTVYNYFIYTVSVQFGPLFLLWVAVLGASTFALIGGLATTDHELVRSHYRDAPSSLVGWFLIAAAALFTLTWLRDIVPALLAGAKPTSAAETGLPTNPVHVLDLAVFLPAVFATGVLLLRHRPLAYTTAPALLVFLILTTLPALATPFIAAARGGLAPWALLAPLSLIAMLSLITLVLYLRRRATPAT